MAFSWGDGWDVYSAFADAYAGYWDSGAGTPTFVAGRFAGSQALHITTTATNLTKSSGQNDAVHHLVVAFRQTAAITGTTLGLYLQLLDATTGQCCVVFRSDGAILLTSGTPGGTVLDTYAGAFPVTNTWYAFDIEITINSATGRFRVRKNGNTSDDYDSTAIRNTRVSANNYANKLTIGMQAAVNAHEIDDTFWQSSAAAGGFLSDIRCYTRMPASDASTQFARTPTTGTASQSTPSVSTATKAANLGMMSAFTATFTGTIASAVLQITTGATGNMKAAIYDSTRTTVLATSNAVVNPVSGLNTITFVTPLAVTKGTVYHLAVDQDATIVYTTTSTNQYWFTTTYASFPAANPTISLNTTGPVFTVTIVPTVNADYVNDPQQDAATSYVYDSTPGDQDFYGIGSIASTPVSTVAVTTRAYMQKSDAGSRTAAVQLKSGGTTVASPTLTLTTSGWLWAWRTDVTDPATSAAWTAAAVNGVQVGPRTVA